MKKILLVLSFLTFFSFLLLWQNKSYLSTSRAQTEPEIPGGAWVCWIDATKLTDEDLQYIASHYDIYRDQGNNLLTKEQIARLHQLNSDLKILVYDWHGGVCANRNWKPLVNQHPEWWLRSTQPAADPEIENGENKIVTWIEEGCKVLKPNLSETREFIWEHYQDKLQKGYDGIFADISGPGVWSSNFRPQSPETPIIDPDPQRGGNYTQAEWISDQIGRLKFLKQRLGEKLHLWNPIPYNWVPYKNTKYFWGDSDSDGAQFDGFLNERNIGEVEWKERVNVLADAIRTGQIILVKTKNLDDPLAEREKIKVFSFASYLLTIPPTNDRSVYFCHCYVRERELKSLVEDTRPQAKIGKPIQNSDTSSNNYVNGFKIQGHNSYRRNFEYGTVLVNPTSSKDENINLGGNYYDGTTRVTQINLPAFSAKILTKAPLLSSGWNQITWPEVSGYTAKTALEDIDNDCEAGTAITISRKRKDWWEDYVKNYGGENFALQTNQNYFIKAGRECSWNP